MKNIIGKIIDFKIKGNIVKFYLGNKTDDWGWANKDYKDYNGNTPDWLQPSDTYYGDDWDYYPYECNAGTVYDEFIYETRTYYFDMNWIIVEPCSGEFNSSYCKDDFKNRKIPCVIVIKGEFAKKYWLEDKYSFWWNFINNCDYDKQEIECFYFEDDLMSGETLETERSSITI